MITDEQRQKASTDLTITLLNSYYTGWRLTKVLGIKKMLDNRYEFYDEFREKIKNEGDELGYATIAQEIKNGLYFDAISECVQYVEDLFAIIHASSKPDYFAKEFINYYANDISKFITKFKVQRETLSDAFHFPLYEMSKEEDKITFEENVNLLGSIVTDCINFYIKYRFVYNQYKHGLTVGMRTFGHIFTEEQIEEDRKGEFPPYLSVYDNTNLDSAQKKGRFNASLPVIIPGLTPNVQPYINELIKEDNFLRLVPIHDTEINIDMFIQIAHKTKMCLNILKYNYSWKILPELNKIKYQLPDNYDKEMYTQYTLFTSDELD